ncbi:MAG: SPOR domain-containing protein [Tepidisphaerales bacterium]
MDHPSKNMDDEFVSNRVSLSGSTSAGEYSGRAAWMRRGIVLVLSCIWLTGCDGTATTADLKAAEAALSAGDFGAAIAAADKVLMEGDGGAPAARALYVKGRAIEDQASTEADLREAWRNYSEALQAGPTPGLEGYIRTSLAKVAYYLGEYATAERQWGIAYDLLKAADLRAWVLYGRGLCQQRQGQWVEADATFAAVQKEYPDTEPATRAAAKAGAKAFYVQVGAYEKAASADAVVGQLRARGFAAGRSPSGQLHRVVVGPFTRYVDAATARRRIGGEFRDAIIVP